MWLPDDVSGGGLGIGVDEAAIERYRLDSVEAVA